ncbi:MAG: glycosyltransferase [Planctomycetota bacterium]
MRILHVMSDLDPRSGGTTEALVGMAAAQHHAGLDVRVVVSAKEGHQNDKAEVLEALGINMQLVGPATGSLLRHPQLKPVLNQATQDADVVHVHGLWEDAQHLACRAAQRTQTPYVVSPHGMLDPWSLSQSALKKKMYLALRLRRNLNRATAMHFTTEGERRAVAPLALKCPPLVETLGLDLTEFDPPPEPGGFRALCPELGDRTIVVFLSRLHHKKGLDLLIPAFAQASDERHVLALVGPAASDEYEQQLRALAKDSGVADRVVFAGMLRGADRLKAFVDAAFFALPSYQENFGIVVAEALACGRPVLISDKVNLSDFVEEQQVGRVVTTDVDAVAQAIREMLADEKGLAATGRRAAEAARQAFDWPKIGERWRDHYAKLVG